MFFQMSLKLHNHCANVENASGLLRSFVEGGV